MNIKQPCCRKVPNVPEPLFHMRLLGQQDVLKFFQTRLVLEFLTKLFSFSPKVLFLKLWIIIEDAKRKMNISRKSWSYYFWILEWLSTAKIGNTGISSKTNFISELIRESRNSGNIIKISQSLFQKKYSASVVKNDPTGDVKVFWYYPISLDFFNLLQIFCSALFFLASTKTIVLVSFTLPCFEVLHNFKAFL